MDVVGRLRRLPAGVVEIVVALGVAWPALMDAWWNAPGTRQADTLTYGLVGASLVALLVRRRWPYGVALVCGAALSALYGLGHQGELLNLPTLVALYTVAVQGERWSTVVTGVVAGTWSGVVGFTSSDPLGAPDGVPMLEILWPLVPLALGEAVRARRQLLAQAATEHELRARRRIEAERARMARELHDVVAHTMVAVNVQMAAAVAAFDTNPDTTRQALHLAQASSRAALQELRASVALMRDDTAAADTSTPAPAPTLDQLAELAGPARTAGIAVTIDDDRGRAELSGAVELTAYRIVQEALTNVVRHSGARSAHVSLRPTPAGLVVEVVDDGTSAGNGAVAGQAVHRFGLIGMAERARAVGGRLDHGPVAGGGFRVCAVLPTSAGPP
jgi:signal transduction histidine kinase